MNIIWSGIYKNFKSINETKDAFNSQKWVNNLSKEKKIHKPNYNLNKNLHLQSAENQYLNIFQYLKKKLLLKSKISIADYGGALGSFYFKLSNNIQNTNFDWHVIEKKNVVKIAKKKFKKEKNLKFKNRIYFKNEIDIFFAGSSMQYINNWKKLILQFINKDTNIFVLCDLPLVNKTQIITKQNYFGIYVPVRFYNLKILKNFFENNGYTLLYKNKFQNYYEKYTSKELKKYNLKFFNFIFIKKKFIK